MFKLCCVVVFMTAIAARDGDYPDYDDVFATSSDLTDLELLDQLSAATTMESATTATTLPTTTVALPTTTLGTSTDPAPIDELEISTTNQSKFFW